MFKDYTIEEIRAAIEEIRTDSAQRVKTLTNALNQEIMVREINAGVLATLANRRNGEYAVHHYMGGLAIVPNEDLRAALMSDIEQADLFPENAKHARAIKSEIEWARES